MEELVLKQRQAEQKESVEWSDWEPVTKPAGENMKGSKFEEF